MLGVFKTNEYPRVDHPDVRSRGLSASRWTTGGTNPPLRGWSPEPPLFGLWVSRGFLRPSPPGYETSPPLSPVGSSPLEKTKLSKKNNYFTKFRGLEPTGDRGGDVSYPGGDGRRNPRDTQRPKSGGSGDHPRRGGLVLPHRPPVGRETPTPAIFAVYPMVFL